MLQRREFEKQRSELWKQVGRIRVRKWRKSCFLAHVVEVQQFSDMRVGVCASKPPCCWCPTLCTKDASFQNLAIRGQIISITDALIDAVTEAEIPGVRVSVVTATLEGHAEKLPPARVGGFSAVGTLGAVRCTRHREHVVQLPHTLQQKHRGPLQTQSKCFLLMSLHNIADCRFCPKSSPAPLWEILFSRHRRVGIFPWLPTQCWRHHKQQPVQGAKACQAVVRSGRGISQPIGSVFCSGTLNSVFSCSIQCQLPPGTSDVTVTVRFILPFWFRTLENHFLPPSRFSVEEGLTRLKRGEPVCICHSCPKAGKIFPRSNCG